MRSLLFISFTLVQFVLADLSYGQAFMSSAFIKNGKKKIMIAAASNNTCALVNGGVKCWGYNLFGQLGNGTTTNSLTPVQVTGLTSGVQTISGGTYHNCALVNGGVKCWGYNPYGNLGNGTGTNSSVPVQVTGLTSGVQATSGSSKYHTTCALVSGGVKCWGSNQYGELGIVSPAYSLSPVNVTGLAAGAGVQAISVGDRETCALVNSGVKCWGWNNLGQLGNGTTINSSVPVQVTGLTSGVQAISAGSSFICALVNGGVKCWGSNTTGVLGNGTTTSSSVPVQVTGLTAGVQAVSLGTQHICALVNGGVKCWGSGYHGTLGNGTTTDSFTPVPVTGLTSGVQAIATGFYHTCALLVNGGVKCWGDNPYGELGNGTTTYSSIPVNAIL
jgi:alpha-tubulin suppressor-like RCC1 family protein